MWICGERHLHEGTGHSKALLVVVSVMSKIKVWSLEVGL